MAFSLENRLKERALALGFELAGIASAGPADSFDHLRAWLDQGYAGAMDYMIRHALARRHPSSILPNVRSVVMLGLNYSRQPAVGSPQSTAQVARYARGLDYHQVLRKKLKHLLAWIQGEVPGCHGRCVVDTAPLLERD